MKKTYKNPTLTVVKIQPAQFIANSYNLSGTQAHQNSDSTYGMARRGRFSGRNEEEW